MKSPFEAWRRSPLLWGVPLGFCILTLLLLLLFHAVYAGDVEELEQQRQAEQAELTALEDESERIDAFLGRIEGQDRDVDRLYREYFKTEADRFTSAVKEVKKLAADAGLNPTAFSYPVRELESGELVERGINFSVEGSYLQLRTFINFLELTDQFLALQSVALSGSSADPRDPKLAIRLRLATVFVRSGPLADGASGEGANGTAATPVEPET